MNDALKNEVTDAKAKREQFTLNAKIADRAEKEFGRMDRMSLLMDLDSGSRP